MLEKIKRNKFVSFIIGITLLLSGNTAMQTLGGGDAIATTASTTAYVITTSASQRIVATSSKRVALKIDSLLCPPSVVTYLNLETPDGAATAAAGTAVIASSSALFSDRGELPVSTNSIQAITVGGDCTVNVTEWFSNN